jgi:alpha-tubulin suppressor-like RCC1 family protein
MMPPEGYSIRCLQEPDLVHRFSEGKLHHYPNGLIASSWNANWREDLLDVDCDGIPIGTPMSMNFDAIQMARSKEWSTTTSEAQDICEVVQEAADICNTCHSPQQPSTRDPTPSSQRNDVLIVRHFNSCANDNTTGELYCWGINDWNQLLDGTKSDRNTPMLFPSNHVDIVHGFQSCMILQSGELKCWGMNNFGQLGLGHKNNVDTPTTVVGVHGRGNSGAIQVALGNQHTCIIDTYNTVYCWGYNRHGQLGVGSKVDAMTPTIVSLGIGIGAIQIAAGSDHTCVIDTDNNVQCWGRNHAGQSGIGDNTDDQLVPAIVSLEGGVGAVHIAAHRFQTCVIDTAGNVQCWGEDHNNTPTIIPLGEGVLATQLGVGKFHVCVLVNDMTNPLKCWGDNSHLQLGDGTSDRRDTPTNVVLEGVEGVITELKSGVHHNCIVVLDDETKKVFCWGGNDRGELGDSTNDKRNTPVLVL